MQIKYVEKELNKINFEFTDILLHYIKIRKRKKDNTQLIGVIESFEFWNIKRECVGNQNHQPQFH